MLQIVEQLLHKDIRLVAMKESIRFEGKQNVQTKALIALFGLFAKVERDLIAERTREGLSGGQGERHTPWPPEGGLGDIQTRRQGGGNRPAPAQAGLESVHCADRRGLAHDA